MKSAMIAMVSAAMLAAAPAQAATNIAPAFTYTSASQLTDSSNYTLGFSFSLSGAKSVNALGYTTVGFTSAQTVGLWDSAGKLLTSAIVNPTDTLVSNYRWTSIAPLLLSAGTYTLAATFTGGPFISDLQGVSTTTGYTYLTDRQQFGSGLNFPTVSTGGGYGAQGIAQANISFAVPSAVPEPASWAMMILGMGMVGFAMRRRAKVATTVRFA